VKAAIVPLSAVLAQDMTSLAVDAGQTYRSAGILNRGRGLFNKGEFTGADTSYKTLFPIKTGQIIYSKLFGWEGAVTTVPNAFDGCYVSSEFPHFDVDNSAINAVYLDHYLKSPSFSTLLATAGSGLGQRRQRVNVDAFLALPLPLPSRPDQDRIAAHLDSIAAPITYAITAAAKADQLLHHLREKVFTDLANYDGLTPLRQVARSTSDLEDVDPDLIYPLLGVRSFGRGAFDAGVLLGSETSYKKLRRFHAGQVCYPKLMGWQGAFTTVPQPLDGYYASPEFVGFDIDPARTSVSYIDQCLRWSVLVDAAAMASTGTNANRRRLQPQDFLSLLIPLPDLGTQDIVSGTLRRVSTAATTARVIAQTGTAILPAARSRIFESMARQ